MHLQNTACVLLNETFSVGYLEKNHFHAVQQNTHQELAYIYKYTHNLYTHINVDIKFQGHKYAE